MAYKEFRGELDKPTGFREFTGTLDTERPSSITKPSGASAKRQSWEDDADQLMADTAAKGAPEQPSLGDRFRTTVRGLGENLSKVPGGMGIVGRAATALTSDAKPASVFDGYKQKIGDPGYDPMLNPEFIEGFRNELGSLPVESRLTALRQYAENDKSVYGRAARVILSQEEAANRKITAENRTQAKGLVGSATVPQPVSFGGTGRRAAFVDARPNFLEEFDGVTAKDKGKIEELARGLATAQEEVRRNPSLTEETVRQARIDSFVKDNPTLGWVYDKYAAETLKGVGIGVKALSDVFGADSNLSSGIQSVIDGVTARQSTQQKALEKQRGDAMEEYADGGVIDQLKGAAKAFAVDPAGLMFNTLGIMGPMLAGGGLLSGTKAIQSLGATGAKLIGKAGSITSATTAGAAVTGGVMGAGFAKGAIYDAVFQMAKAEGYSDADAKKIAAKSQSYTENPDVIALVAVATAAGAGTGLEPMLLNMFGRESAKQLLKQGIIKSVAVSVSREMPLEFAQGASEKFASNVAAKRAGFDVAPLRGVWTNGFLEGMASGGLAAGGGAARSNLRLRDETEQQAAARILAAELDAGSPQIVGGANAAAVSRLDPNTYDPRIVDPLQTVRQSSDVGPSAPSTINFTPADSPTRAAGLPDIVVPTPAPAAQPQGPAPATEEEITQRATLRLAELEAISRGTADMQAVDPATNQPVTVPGTPGRFFTNEEKQEYDALQKNLGNPAALAKQFNAYIGTPTATTTGAPNVGTTAGAGPATATGGQLSSDLGGTSLGLPGSGGVGAGGADGRGTGGVDSLAGSTPTVAGTGGQPAADLTPRTNLAQRATDADLLNRVQQGLPQEDDVKPWAGRSNLGYATEQDAEQARATASAVLDVKDTHDWRVEPMGNGRFHLVPYPKETTNANQTTQAQQGQAQGQEAPAASARATAAAPVAPAGTAVEAAPTVQHPEQQAPRLYGRDSVPVDEGGQPFATRREAQKAKSLQPLMRIKEVDGGFVLTEKTPAQLAAEEQAAKRLGSVGAGGRPLAAHELIAAMGGLNISAKADLGFDVRENPRIGAKFLFTKSGMSMERATELLQQNGYMEGTDQNRAMSLIQMSAKGNPQYTAEGYEAIAQAESEARFEDYYTATNDFTLGPEDFDADVSAQQVSAELKREVQALISAAEAAGIDVETILERAAQMTEGRSDQEYYELARQELSRTLEQQSAVRGSAEPAERAGAGQGWQAAEQGSDGAVRQDNGREGQGAVDAQSGQVNEAGAQYSVRQQFSLFGDNQSDQLQLFIDRGPVESQAGDGARAAQRRSIEAVADLHATSTILALALSRDYAARQRVSLVGQKISGTEDLAVLAQVYRDPRFETFRVVFVDANDKVMSQIGLTSRLPTSTAVLIGNDFDGYLNELAAAAKKGGAAGYYLLHNHPSGKATPSLADVYVTRDFAAKMPGLQFKSHVVIDTNEYATIDGSGNQNLIKKDFGQPAPLTDVMTFTSPDDVMAYAKRLQVEDGAVTLIATDAQYQVKAITTIPQSELTGSKGMVRLKVARALMRLNSSNVFAVGREQKSLLKLSGAVVDAIHISQDGEFRSLAMSGVVPTQGSAFPKDRRPRVSPDTSPDFSYLRFKPSTFVSGNRVAEPGAQLTAPTQADILAQQERADNAAARDQREQVRRESEVGASLFRLEPQDGRQGQQDGLKFSRRALPSTIEIDGKQRPTQNSEGQPIHPTIEGVRNFWRWFGNSRVVDAQGRPLVVYHGTGAGGFDAFQGLAWFTDDPAKADQYANQLTREGKLESTVYPVYLKITKPKFIDFFAVTSDVENALAKRGTDAVIVRGFSGGNAYVVKTPSQIKSATGNQGTFDGSNPDIRRSFAGSKAETADQFQLSKAREMLDRGADPEAVRRQTGWMRGPDGQWRFEISDDEAVLTLPGGATQWLDLGDILSHPKLYAAYPVLRDMSVRLLPASRMNGSRGSFAPGNLSITLSADLAPDEALSTLMHEVQHAIQEYEGFAVGGSADREFGGAVKDALSELEKQAKAKIEVWRAKNQDKLDAEAKTSLMARQALMWESAERLMDYANRDKPSGVFRLIRNEMQWIYGADFRGNQEAMELQRMFYNVPPSHKMKERNAYIRDMAERASQLLTQTIGRAGVVNFREDPRTTKAVVAAMRRQADKARKALAPLNQLEREARNAATVKQSHEFSTAYEVYRALAGEVEARNTQARLRLTEAERQATSPLTTADVKPEQVVVLFGGLQIEAPLLSLSLDPTRQTAPSTPITDIRAAITAAYGNLLPQLEKRGLFVLTQTQDEALTAAAQARADQFGGDVESIKRSLAGSVDVKRSTNGDVQAFYDPETGKTFMVADNMTAQNAPGVLTHEVGIHMANDAQPDKGKAKFDQMLNRAQTMIRAGKGNAFFDRVAQRLADAGETSAEEAAAYLVEEYENNRQNAPKPVVQWLRDFAAAIRAWLFDRGIIIKADDLTAADIAAVARANAVKLARGDIAPEALARVFGSDTIRGKFSQAKFTNSAAFKRWFGDSKVVDADGKPLVSISGLIAARKSAMLEGGVDSGPTDAEPVADLLVSKSFSLEGLGGLEIPAQRKVLDSVLALGDDLKVLRSVVQLIPVDVMNILAGKNLSPESLFRNEAVLKELLSADFNGSVTTAIDVADALVVAVAGVATKGSAITTGPFAGARERDAAAGAGNRDELHAGIINQTIGNNGQFDPTSPDIRRSARQQPINGQNFELPGEGKWMATRRALQDQFIRMREVQDAIVEQGGTVGEAQNVYLAEELSYGRIQEQMKDFAEKWVKPMTQRAAKAGIDLDELALYAYAKHAPERNKDIASKNQTLQDGGSGMTNQEAADILAKFDQEGKTQKLEDLRQDLLAITDTTRMVMLQEGLITQEQYDAMQEQFQDYVPLRGFERQTEDGQKAQGRGAGKGFNVRGPETMKALGRTSRAGDIIENIVGDYERAIVRAERNNVAKAFLDLVTTNPNPNLWEIDAVRTTRSLNRKTGQVEFNDLIDKGEDTVAVKVGGKEVFIKIKDPLLARALRQAWKDETGATARILNNSIGVYTNWMRNVLTRYNVAFSAVNAARDFQAGGVAAYDKLGSAGAKLYFKYYAQAVAASFRNEVGRLDQGAREMDKWFEEFRAAGGTTGGFFMRDAEEISNDIRTMLLAAGAAPKGKVEAIKGSKAFAGAKAMLRALEILGSASENAARVAAYRAAREIGKSPAEAASIAKNLTTNFNRKGEWGQVLNSLYLFFNAAVQGSHRVIQSLKNPKVRALMYGVTGTAMGLAFMGASMGGDDEDGEAYWDQIPDFEKERNIIIMLPPGTEMDGAQKVGTKGRYIKIPAPYGFNIFPAIGYALADLARYSMDPNRGASPAQAGIRTVSAVFGAYNPMGGSFDISNPIEVGMAAAPTVIDLPIQLAAGVDSFGRPVGQFRSPQDPRPDSEVAGPKEAGSVSQRLARWMNEATGGNAGRSGAIDVQPATINNLARTFGGGAGDFLWATLVNIPSKALTPEAEIMLRDVPVAKAFAGSVDKNTDMRKFYERRAEVLKEYKSAINEMQLGIFVDYDKKSRGLQVLGGAAEEITSYLVDIRKEELRIADHPTMTKGEKIIARRELEKMRVELARQFNSLYSAQMREVKASQ